jgi:3-hydroxyacyl-[acyl-carrier-protein] dehydratase
MPSELLIDLEALDLSATAADLEGVAAVIPHRGDMLLLDSIVWHDEAFDHGVARKHVHDDEFWCAGHIPTRPIMPGVLLVEAGAQLSSWLYYKRSGAKWFAGFTRIENTAFRGQVVPGDDLLLLCRCTKYSERRFVTMLQGLVEDRLVFESTITGMAFPKDGDAPRVPLDAVPRSSGRDAVSS